ncbi:hypothetical protein [Maribacter sp. 2308TA10-17]|uniref:hypothetical protein n=1 Tax=Maribacter sp. 2308TA10-17 TaxID=3386276 RepID=UPI0039BD2CE0
MKKILIVVMLMAGGIIFAQKGERGGKERMKDLSPEQIATLQAKKATLALDLTSAQQTQMKAFFEENAKMRKAKMEERKARKESDETKELTSEERYARTNERLDHQIAQKAKLKEILSEEQLAKWEKMKHRRAKGKKGSKAKERKNKSRK